jgi:hypothetical protein
MVKLNYYLSKLLIWTQDLESTYIILRTKLVLWHSFIYPYYCLIK